MALREILLKMSFLFPLFLSLSYHLVCIDEMLIFSCRIRERKESVTVLLCGTSGCGKSTLSALLVFLCCLNFIVLLGSK